jgi:hypothetical protein
MDADFGNYLAVLETVQRIAQREQATQPRDLDENQVERFRALDFMFGASPSLVQELRRHCHHISGPREEDYGPDQNEHRGLFKQKLKRLVKVGGRDILVTESPALGGFGFRVDGELYNLDTLKFYEAMIAMRRSAILGDFIEPTARRTVVEINAGWGGFAYAFKTLCPNTTYVIVDHPQRFLFSAVYLMNRFPEAIVRFVEQGSDTPSGGVFQEIDFLFVPDSCFDALHPERLDLVINLLSFERKPASKVEAYLRWAYELECPFVYSFNRDHNPANDDLASLTDIIRGTYWPHDIPVMPVDFNKMLDGVVRGKSLRARLQRQNEKRGKYRHIIGWRRLLR